MPGGKGHNQVGYDQVGYAFSTSLIIESRSAL